MHRFGAKKVGPNGVDITLSFAQGHFLIPQTPLVPAPPSESVFFDPFFPSSRLTFNFAMRGAAKLAYAGTYSEK